MAPYMESPFLNDLSDLQASFYHFLLDIPGNKHSREFIINLLSPASFAANIHEYLDSKETKSILSQEDTINLITNKLEQGNIKFDTKVISSLALVVRKFIILESQELETPFTNERLEEIINLAINFISQNR